MLSMIFSWLNPISAILGELAKWRISLANAQTEQERIEALKQVAMLQAQVDAYKAASGSLFMMSVLFFLTLPFGLFTWKVIVWDKILGYYTQGNTDALDPNMWYVFMMVFGFWFAHLAVEKWRG